MVFKGFLLNIMKLSPTAYWTLLDHPRRAWSDGSGTSWVIFSLSSTDQNSWLVVENHVTQQPNDKQKIKPALAILGALSDKLGHIRHLTADTGVLQRKVIPLLACGQETHIPTRKTDLPMLARRPPPQRMRWQECAAKDKAIYAKRKSTVEMEPVFGTIKQVMGFRQFLLQVGWGLWLGNGRGSVLATIWSGSG